MIVSRRNFGKLAALSIGVGMVSCVTRAPGLGEEVTHYNPKRIKPRALKPGDTIGLIAPGSPVSEEVYLKARKQLEALGFQVRDSKNLRASHGYLAGTDAQRLEDIHEAFANPEIQGIWCIRGGYGTTRLLPMLDYDLIRKNPKILIGYSDITALIQGIFLKTGLIGFHGPVAATTFTDYTLKNFRQMVMGAPGPINIESLPGEGEIPGQETVVWVDGKGEGPLAGGNLSLLAALAGTPYALDCRDKLLFIEDVGEKPYRIDRMLTQLLQSTRLDQAAGIILGKFNDCEPEEGDLSLSLEETLKDRLIPLNIPLISGFTFGHIDNMCTFPVGVKAVLDTARKSISLKESPVDV